MAAKIRDRKLCVRLLNDEDCPNAGGAYLAAFCEGYLDLVELFVESNRPYCESGIWSHFRNS